MIMAAGGMQTTRNTRTVVNFTNENHIKRLIF